MIEPHKQKSTAEKRQQQVMSAIDRIASKDELAFLTTQRVSQASKVSDGVLFRHFSSKEVMVSTWLEQRTAQLQALMEAMPAGRDGLLYFLRALCEQDKLLTFICCQPVDITYLRQAMEKSRLQVWQMFNIRIDLLSSTPVNIAADVLTDHLFQSLYRAWNPNNPERFAQQETLMNQLPWEKTPTNQQSLPSQEQLQRLALNDSGFVFDPVSGLSFTANAVGLYVLRFLQRHDDASTLYAALAEEFDVSQHEAERDLSEFFAQVRKCIA